MILRRHVTWEMEEQFDDAESTKGSENEIMAGKSECGLKDDDDDSFWIFCFSFFAKLCLSKNCWRCLSSWSMKRRIICKSITVWISKSVRRHEQKISSSTQASTIPENSKAMLKLVYHLALLGRFPEKRFQSLFWSVKTKKRQIIWVKRFAPDNSFPYSLALLRESQSAHRLYRYPYLIPKLTWNQNKNFNFKQ